MITVQIANLAVTRATLPQGGTLRRTMQRMIGGIEKAIGKKLNFPMRTRLERKAMELEKDYRESIHSAAALAHDRLRVETPRRTGKTADAWNLTVADNPTDVRVTFAHPNSLLIHWLNAGTKAHEIRAVKAKALRFMDASGNPVYRVRVWHPGTQAHAFVDRAKIELLDNVKRIRVAVEGLR